MSNEHINLSEAIITSALMLFFNACAQQSTLGRFALGRNEGLITMDQSKPNTFLNHLWFIQDSMLEV